MKTCPKCASRVKVLDILERGTRYVCTSIRCDAPPMTLGDPYVRAFASPEAYAERPKFVSRTV